MGGKNGVSFLFGAGRRVGGDGASCEECGGQGCSEGLCVCEHWSL